LHCQPQRTRSHVQPRQMAPTNPELCAQFLALFEAAPDKVDWLLKQHTLGADRIYLMKDKIKSLDKEHDALMEEKRRYEALDLMRSAARLPVAPKPRARPGGRVGGIPAAPSSKFMGVWSSGRANGVHPWRAVRHIDKSTRVYIGYFKTQEEAAIAYDAFMIADWRFSWAPGDPRLNTVKHASNFLGLCPEIRRAAEEEGRSSATRQRPPMRAPAPRGSFDFGGVRGALPRPQSLSDDDGAASDASRFVRDEDVRARGSFGYKD
jgi:hypothetical protein